ncbi:hydrogenase expression/formation protein HypC [Hydrogenispora ethanolica]|jgi:hydrogenase expression/formation protein HypC|uniref:Hydrogenase expression/formation protein HypC n=1 Tax=Hydrogenispora ethanolica TaxID=1082276 RepID=A0A4R1RM72_HYDET|nr:HypC/HybG/HupF family hydrogenase formation chaperone [Hydrogenispora ethanolica]TCL67358.1 hydrogenase expression/formation protein HypC [Hydrogenispora ethanolica]
MCLAVPGEVVAIEGNKAKVSFSGVFRSVDLSLVAGVKVGDYVLVHAGCAIQVVPPDEARETIQLFSEVFGDDEH